MKNKQSPLNFFLNTIHYYVRHPLQFLTGLLYLQATVISTLTSQEKALRKFGDCLEDNSNQLEIRDLLDIYRVRGIPEECCSSFVMDFFPSELMESEDFDPSNCRLNAFFVPGGIFDPHNHPSSFVSYVISGAYAHTLFEKENSLVANDTSGVYLPCTPMFDEVCAEFTKIYRASDTQEKLGTVKLLKVGEEFFSKGYFITYDDTKIIHRIDRFSEDTLTINYINKKGDDEIDVYTSHDTPDRGVLSKAETRKPIDEKISSNIIKKSISFFRTDQTEDENNLKEQMEKTEDENNSKKQMEKTEVILILGMPGAGKSSISNYLVRTRKGYTHLSTGDIFRFLSSGKTEKAKRFRETVFSDYEVYKILKKYIKKNSGGEVVLLDGFPRNSKQLDLLLNDKSIQVALSIYLRCSDEICRNRVLERGQNRLNDTAEIFSKRLIEFQEKTMPIIQFLSKHYNTVEIDLSQPRKIVYQKLDAIIEEYIVAKEVSEDSINNLSYGAS